MRSFLYLSSGLILSMVFLAGCGGNTTPVSTAPPPPVVPTYVASAKNAYVATTAGFIDEYSISTAGQWTLIGSGKGSPGGIGSAALAIDPAHRFLYQIAGGDANSIISMPNRGDNTIAMYSVSPSTGLLTSLGATVHPVLMNRTVL